MWGLSMLQAGIILFFYLIKLNSEGSVNIIITFVLYLFS